MKTNKNKLAILVLVILLGSVSCIIKPKAAKLVGSDTCYSFNQTTGAYIGSGKDDCVKKIDNSYAYCVEWSKEITTTDYSVDSSWTATSKAAIISGIIIEKTNSEYSGIKAYATTSATLNTYSKKALNNPKSISYYDKNTAIKSIYDSAVKEYGTYKVSTSIPKIKTSNTETFNYSNGTYISDKVTISELLKTYGGSGDKVKYTISADKGAKICSNASGIESSCSTSVTVTDQTSYSFYVKATNVKASEVVKVTISGSNESTYPSSKRYIVSGDSSQKLIVKSSVTIKRSNSTSLQLTVPNTTNHTIQAKKVNEHGDLITGAVLEIYQDTPYTGKLLASGQTNSIVTYTSPIQSTEDDNFFTHDYYLVEKQAPDGYILNSEIHKIYNKNSSSNANNATCYYNGGSDSTDSTIVDNERCNFTNYENKCQGSDGSIRDLTEDKDCIFEIPEETTAPVEENPDNNPTEENPGESTENNDSTEEEKITYEKVCYKINPGSVIADNTYCDNKSDYTKVERKSGNLVITQPNTKNVLKISKKAITGDEEVAGAKLKICTKDSYESSKEACEAASTIEDIKMEWISGNSPKEYHGIPKGDYYIIETIAPNGYIKTSTVTSFSVDSTGHMVSDKKELEDNTIVIKNQLNSLSISKQDMTTSKELPGATLSICITYVDKNNIIQLEKNQHTGDCIPAILADGTKATWVSKKEPHKIQGLAAGAYYLVENIAPTNYSTAESILFIVTEDGKVLDKDGKSVADNKIVMKDKLISNPKTAELPIIAIVVLTVAGLATGIICYNRINKKNNKITSKKDDKKISKK